MKLSDACVFYSVNRLQYMLCLCPKSIIYIIMENKQINDLTIQ